jgi:hypothetical protein
MAIPKFRNQRPVRIRAGVRSKRRISARSGNQMIISKTTASQTQMDLNADDIISILDVQSLVMFWHFDNRRATPE